MYPIYNLILINNFTRYLIFFFSLLLQIMISTTNKINNGEEEIINNIEYILEMINDGKSSYGT